MCSGNLHLAILTSATVQRHPQLVTTNRLSNHLCPHTQLDSQVRPHPTSTCWGAASGMADDDEDAPFNILEPRVTGVQPIAKPKRSVTKKPGTMSTRTRATRSGTAPKARAKARATATAKAKAKAKAKAVDKHCHKVDFGAEAPALADAFKWADKFVTAVVQHVGANLGLCSEL